MPVNVFDPQLRAGIIIHQPLELIQLGFEEDALNVVPRLGRVEFADVVGLAIFEKTEGKHRKLWMMLMIRGQSRPLLVEPVKIQLQALAFQDAASGLDKLRALGLLLCQRGAEILIDRNTDQFLKGAPAFEFQREPMDLATAYADVLMRGKQPAESPAHPAPAGTQAAPAASLAAAVAPAARPTAAPRGEGPAVPSSALRAPVAPRAPAPVSSTRPPAEHKDEPQEVAIQDINDPAPAGTQAAPAAASVSGAVAPAARPTAVPRGEGPALPSSAPRAPVRRTRPPSKYEDGSLRIGQFTVRDIDGVDAFYRVYLHPDEIFFIRIMKGGPGALGNALAKQFGLLGALLASFSEKRAEEKFRLRLMEEDKRDPRQRLSEHRKSFRVLAAELVSASMEPPSFLRAPHWAFTYRRKKYKMLLEKPEDQRVAFRGLPRVIGRRLEVNVAWDSNKKRLRKKR